MLSGMKGCSRIETVRSTAARTKSTVFMRAVSVFFSVQGA
jgi:hypothetical protein